MIQRWNKDVIDKKRKKSKDNILKIAYSIEKDAKMGCPVDSGRLRSSITTVQEQKDNKWMVKVGTNVFYAVFQNFGTRFIKATFFLTNAWDKNIKSLRKM